MSNYSQLEDSKRWSLLDQFMEQYLKTDDRVSMYRSYEYLLKQVQPIDLFHVSMYHNDTNLSVDDIRENAGRFVNLFYHGLTAYQWNREISSLMILLLEENQKIKDRLELLKKALDPRLIASKYEALIAFFESMVELEKKFIKMQNILFPVLEVLVPSKTPFKVLWSIHDDLNHMRQNILKHLQSASLNWDVLKVEIGEYYYQLYALMQKEELIIFPIASEKISIKQWSEMEVSAQSIGYAFLNINKQHSFVEQSFIKEGIIHTTSGDLTFEQFELIMGHLPISLTYVDEFDQVRYFNQTKHRHFPRTPQVIGRLVKDCHPEKSVHIVEKIIREFKSGNRQEAVFWINFKNAILLITYYPIKDSFGHYKGVLEVTQDITSIKKIQGEKRLLDWE